MVFYPLTGHQQLTRDDAETKNFIYFYLGPIAILLWKTS